jgi:succinate dehydrogenase / fumarate reductase membrane anchor subunit
MSDKEKGKQGEPSGADGKADDKDKVDSGNTASGKQRSGDDSGSDSSDDSPQADTAKDHDDDSGKDEDDVIKVERTSTTPALMSHLRHSRQYHQARGLGAGGTGAATFRLQRLTALALIPLVLWFGVSVVRLSTATRAAAAAWLAAPVNAMIMAVFIVFALRHAVIGLQIIFEDYVHSEGVRAVCVLAVKAIALALGIAAVAALIYLAL